MALLHHAQGIRATRIHWCVGGKHFWAPTLMKQAGLPAFNLYYSIAYMNPHHVARGLEAGEI
jgi:hypothetical protein